MIGDQALVQEAIKKHAQRSVAINRYNSEMKLIEQRAEIAFESYRIKLHSLAMMVVFGDNP